MKQCPRCSRTYADGTLNFRLEDGEWLLSEPPVSAGGFVDSVEPATAILHETAPPSEAQTRTQIHTTQHTPDPEDGGEKKNRFDKRLIATPLIVALIAIAGFAGYRYLSAGHKTIRSIAVLPFANASGDKETEFLSDGIAETLINNFTKIPELKVTARSTAFHFRGRDGEPKEIGQELGVGSILTGTLVQHGEDLSIQVDLINTSDGSQLWGNRYDGKSGDLVNIQRSIAIDVISQLKLKLTDTETQQAAKTYTQNPAAYQHYLRGRYYWNRRTGDDFKKAIGEFQAATDLDPAYALAYVGLGDSYTLLTEYEGVNVDESMSKARIFEEKALQLDPTLGEPHATLGLINHDLWQWNEADREFRRSIELNPNYPSVHQWYAIYLRELGKYDLALAEIKKAQDLDPLSGIIGVNVGTDLMLNGDPAASFNQLNRVVDLDPGWWGGYYWLGWMKAKDGHIEEAVPFLEKSVSLNRAVRPMGMLGFALAKVGRKDEANALLRELESKYSSGVACASQIATIYAGLGDKDKAFEWLEKGNNEKDRELTGLTWYPQYEPLRDDPRYKNLLKRMNLPE